MKVIDRRTIEIKATGKNLLINGTIAETIPNGKQVAIFTVLDIGPRQIKGDEPISQDDRVLFDRLADRLDIVFFSKKSIDKFIEVLIELSAKFEASDEN